MGWNTVVSVGKILTDPVGAARRVEDAGRWAGHMIHGRSAGDVFVREATVAVRRQYSDTVEGTKRVFRGRF